MKYTQDIIINAPIEKVIALFDDPAGVKYSHPGLASIEHVSGTPRQPGATSVMKYKTFDLTETILARDLPREFTGKYEVESMVNTMKNSFAPLGEDRTRYTIEMDYTFKKMMMKIIALLIPGKFKEQTYKYLELFKEFVENNS